MPPIGSLVKTSREDALSVDGEGNGGVGDFASEKVAQAIVPAHRLDTTLAHSRVMSELVEKRRIVEVAREAGGAGVRAAEDRRSGACSDHRAPYLTRCVHAIG